MFGGGLANCPESPGTSLTAKKYLVTYSKYGKYRLGLQRAARLIRIPRLWYWLDYYARYYGHSGWHVF